MTFPIVPTKLARPSPPKIYLSRSRLMERWDEASAHRVVRVTAAAGFGKTAFLSTVVAESGRFFVWYTLDELDRDPRVLGAHLLPALSTSVPAASRLLASDDIPNLERLAADLARALLRPGRPILVLDDAQAISHAPETCALLDRVIRYIPAGATVVLSSREEIPLTLTRFAVHGDATEIRSSDLAFDAVEIDLFARMRWRGQRLDPEIARRIHELTEGWPAGVEILFQSLAGPLGADIDAALTRLAASGTGWFSYFAEEVMAQLELPAQRFLRKSAVLPIMSAHQCDDILGLDRGQSIGILRDLVRRNLFTFPVESQTPSFRYHPLFRDFLLQQLEASARGNAVRKLRHRAALTLAKAGRWPESLAAFAEIGDADGILGVVRRHADELVSAGKFHLVEEAIAHVPSSLLRRCPRALFVLGAMRDYEGDWNGASRLYRQALRGASPRERIDVLCRLASLHHRRGANATAIKLCQQILDSSPAPPAAVRIAVSTLLGITSCDLGSIDEGALHLERALVAARRAGSRPAEAQALYLLAANVHAPRGDFATAIVAARGALELFQQLRQPHRVCHSLGVLAFVLTESGRTAEASAHAHRALREAESLGYLAIAGYCHYTVGRGYLATRDIERARHHFEAAVLAGQATGESHLRTLPFLGLGDAALLDGDHVTANRLALRVRNTARVNRDELEVAQAMILLARASSGFPGGGSGSTKGTTPRASGGCRALREAERTARKLGATRELHRALLLRHAYGDVPAGEEAETLDALLGGVSARGHGFLFAQHTEEAGTVLRRALALGIRVDFARQQLAVLAAPMEGTSNRKSAVNLLEIRALGALEVRCGAKAPLLADQWSSQRARRLFDLLLVRRFRWVPRDEILEYLWPGEIPHKAANSLRQTIHKLRRTLEPDLPAGDESLYVHFQNESCRLDPGEGYGYDVERFEHALREAERMWDVDDPEPAMRHLEQARDLWGGDFLADRSSEEWLLAERERLRDHYVRALCRLAEAHGDTGRWDEVLLVCQQGLTADPYQEDLHAFRIEARLLLGQRHEALTAFHEYESRMMRDLGLLPSPRLRSLADRAGARAATTRRVTPA